MSSGTHVKVEVLDSNVNFYAGADSKLVQGLMGILTMAIHGSKPEVVLSLTPEFATEMGIPTRYHQAAQTDSETCLTK